LSRSKFFCVKRKRLILSNLDHFVLRRTNRALDDTATPSNARCPRWPFVVNGDAQGLPAPVRIERVPDTLIE
jgi:hypothetical protein